MVMEMEFQRTEHFICIIYTEASEREETKLDQNIARFFLPLCNRWVIVRRPDLLKIKKFTFLFVYLTMVCVYL